MPLQKTQENVPKSVVDQQFLNNLQISKASGMSGLSVKVYTSTSVFPSMLDVPIGTIIAVFEPGKNLIVYIGIF